MRNQVIVYGVLTIWATTMTLIGACLMVGHWVSLPAPSFDDPHLLNLTAASSMESADREWSATHFLFGKCPCSRRVLDRIIGRSPHGEVNEKIVLIDGDEPLRQSAEDAGYRVEVVEAYELKDRYGVEAAPLLVVVDPQGVVKYSGGYTARKQGPDIQAEAILSRLVAGEEVESLPLYGCAVSRNLQAIVDPLRLKSSN